MADTSVDNSDILQGLNVLVNVLPQPGDAETDPLSFAILAEKLREILDLYTSSGTKDQELRARLEALCLDIKAATRAQPILADPKAIKAALYFVKNVDEQPRSSGGTDDNVEDKLESHEEADEEDDSLVDGSNKTLVEVGDDNVDQDKTVKTVPGPVKATASPRKAISKKSAATVSGNKTAAAVVIPIKTESKSLSASRPAPRHARSARVPVKAEPLGETRMKKGLPDDTDSLPMMLKAEYAQRMAIENPALAEYAKNQPDIIKCKNCRDKHEACIVDAKLPKTACLFCKHSHTPKCTIQQDPRPKHQTELLHLEEMDPDALARYRASERPVRPKRKHGEDEEAIVEVKRSKTFDNPTRHSPRGGATTLPESKVSRVSGKSRKTHATSESLSASDLAHTTPSQRFETYCEMFDAFIARITDTISDLRNEIRNMARVERKEGRREEGEEVERDYSSWASVGAEVGDSDNEEMPHGKH